MHAWPTSDGHHWFDIFFLPIVLSSRPQPDATGKQVKQEIAFISVNRDLRFNVKHARDIRAKHPPHTIVIKDHRALVLRPSRRSIAIKNFQKETVQLVINALDNVYKGERDISTVTITLSEKSFQEVRKELVKCRKQILKIAHQEEEADAAYHVNFQLIPIGKRWKEGA